MPIPNVPLLRKVREHIGNHPSEWNQDVWRTPRTDDVPFRWDFDISQDRILAQPAASCDTAFCFAGWALTFDGVDWLDSDYVRLKDGEIFKALHAHGVAQHVLGLSENEADMLFCGLNSLGGIDMVLARIYARAGEAHGE